MGQIKIQHEGKEFSYELKSQQYTIGRSSKCEIQIKDSSISRRHCELKKQGNDWYAIDLDSHNGTFVNGERIKEPRKLRFGDIIKLGNITDTHIAFVKEEAESIKVIEPQKVVSRTFFKRKNQLAVIETRKYTISRRALLLNVAIVGIVFCVVVGVIIFSLHNSNRSNVAILEKTLKELSEENKGLKGEFNKIKEDVKAVDDKDKVAGLEKTLKELYEENKGLEHRLEELKENVKAVGGKDEVTGLEETIRKLYEENKDLERKLESEVANVKEDVKSMKNKMETRKLTTDEASSIVFIEVVKTSKNYKYFLVETVEDVIACASGFIINEDGYILTNRHVVYDEKTKKATGNKFFIFSTTSDDEPATPKYIATCHDYYDPKYDADLAILKITESLANQPLPMKFPYLEFDDNTNLKLSDSLMVIGYPGVGIDDFKKPTMTCLSKGGYSGKRNDWYFKTDLGLLHGISGSPVFNDEHKVVGIATAYRVDVDNFGGDKIMPTGKLGYCVSSIGAMDYLKSKGVKFHKE